ncbi:DUF4192 domain-containing protein [Streptomyces sp. G45]|uniref:DUF4192 domain-containing protein n=1 Tax=Streptomyces sp. G45 TaxID=3406627 RepID=UPI003C1744C5
MARLKPLAQELRTACGSLDVPVLEVVCISDGHFWTYCCPNQRCCPPEGVPLLPAGTSVLAAATVYAGYQVGPAQGQIRARLAPWRTAAAAEQEQMLHAVSFTLVPRILSEADHGEVATETLDLADRLMARFATAPPILDPLEADLQDDALISHDEAAALILGLQDRSTRDRAAEWMEGDEAACALRLWRALARRCVGAFREHAAAPLTLAGWVAWSLGDLAEGQEALTMALIADPRYAFALLLHPVCSADGDPEPIRRILRGERAQREAANARRDQRVLKSAVAHNAEAGAEARAGLKAEAPDAWAMDADSFGDSPEQAEADDRVSGAAAAAGRGAEGDGIAESGGTAATGGGSVGGAQDEVAVVAAGSAGGGDSVTGAGGGPAPRGHRRSPRPAARDSRATGAAGRGPGRGAVDRAGTGPQNRRRTLRRSARNGR